METMCIGMKERQLLLHSKKRTAYYDNAAPFAARGMTPSYDS